MNTENLVTPIPYMKNKHYFFLVNGLFRCLRVDMATCSNYKLERNIFQSLFFLVRKWIRINISFERRLYGVRIWYYFDRYSTITQLEVLYRFSYILHRSISFAFYNYEKKLGLSDKIHHFLCNQQLKRLFCLLSYLKKWEDD